jgi:hypothetical protein
MVGKKGVMDVKTGKPYDPKVSCTEGGNNRIQRSGGGGDDHGRRRRGWNVDPAVSGPYAMPTGRL